MGPEPLLSTWKRFKSLGMQRVENDGFDHIEGWTPKLIWVLRMHKWHFACFIMVPFSYHAITLLKPGVTWLNVLMHIEKKNVGGIAATLVTNFMHQAGKHWRLLQQTGASLILHWSW